MTPVLLGLALAAIFYSHEIAEPGGSRWQSIPVMRYAPDGKTLAIGMYNGRFVYTKGTYYVSDLCATAALVHPESDTPPTIVEQLQSKGIWNALPEVAIGRFLDWSPDGHQLAVGGFSPKAPDETFPGAVRQYSIDDTGTVPKAELQNETLTGTQHIHSVKFFPDGKTLATSFRYWVDLRDPRGERDPQKIETGVNVAGFAISSAGTLLAAIDRGTCRVEFWNPSLDPPKRIAVYEEVDPKGRKDTLNAIALSPDGKTVAIAGERTVRLVDVESNSIKQVLNERMVLDLTYSPDGRYLATGRYDGLQIWGARTGDRIGSRIEMPAIESVEFSPDSRHLATGDETGHVTLWNVESAAPVWKIRLEGRYRTLMPPLVPWLLFAAWLAICAFLVWRKLRAAGIVGNRISTAITQESR